MILSIGAIIALASGFNKLWYALAALGLITIFWLVMSCFFYKTWFDMFFPGDQPQYPWRAGAGGRQV